MECLNMGGNGNLEPLTAFVRHSQPFSIHFKPFPVMSRYVLPWQFSSHFQPFQAIFNNFQPFHGNVQPFKAVFSYFKPFKAIFSQLHPSGANFKHVTPSLANIPISIPKLLDNMLQSLDILPYTKFQKSKQICVFSA